MKKLFLLLACLSATVCSAQGYTPVGKARGASHGNMFVLAMAPATAHCKPSDVPNWDQLKTKRFETHLQIMSATQAASLNITWTGSVSASGNRDQVLAVSDSSRVAPCVATDGKTIVYYGEAIRTVVAMNDYTVKAGASIAIVAATATANGKTNSVDLYEVGFGDPQLDSKLVLAKQALGGSGIDITNYPDFIKGYNAAETYALSVTNPGIDVVGFDTPGDINDYGDMLADVWAIQNIAQGYGCLDAIQKFKQQDQRFQNDIRDTYDQIAGGCGVDDVARAKAVQILNGIKIKY